MLKMPTKKNISTQWKDIEYYDISENKKDRIVITKEEFEKMVGDTFEAVQTDNYGQIKVIWTKKYVFEVKIIKSGMITNILTGYLREWC